MGKGRAFYWREVMGDLPLFLCSMWHGILKKNSQKISNNYNKLIPIVIDTQICSYFNFWWCYGGVITKKDEIQSQNCSKMLQITPNDPETLLLLLQFKFWQLERKLDEKWTYKVQKLEELSTFRGSYEFLKEILLNVKSKAPNRGLTSRATGLWR